MTVRKEWRNPLPGAPDVESPFFDEVFAQKQGAPGWAEIARNLRRDGYAVIDFPAAKFDDLARRVRADLQDGFDLDHWARYVRQGASLRVQDAWTKSAAVREIAVNATVLRLLEFLYGRRAFPFQTLNFPVGTQQHFHSDSVHFSSTPERFMCGVWVALEDVGEENGPLIYYPGSHALPIYTTEHVAHFADDPSKTQQIVFEPLWRELVRVHGFHERQFHARKGQALIWAANLLHGGAPHLDPKRTRWSQVTHYYFDDCAYHAPMQSDPIYGRIGFKEPINIATGARMLNAYLGRPVPQQFVRAASAAANRPLHAEAGFDPRLYLLANPDVAAAGVDALEHWRRYGQFEGRKLRP